MDPRTPAAFTMTGSQGAAASKVPTCTQSVWSAASGTHMKGGPTLTSPCAGSLQGSGSLVYLRPPASCSRRPAPPRPRGRPDPRRRREGCDVLVAEPPDEHFVRLWVDPESGCREMRGSVSSNISCSFGERESFSTAWTSVIRSCRVWPSRRSTASVTSRPALAPPGPGPVRW